MGDSTQIETSLNWTGSDVFTTNAGKSHGIQVIGMGGLENHPIAWSPVHMFVSSVESCYFATCRAILEKARVKLKSFNSRAFGELTSDEEHHKEISKITLNVEVRLENKDEEAKTREMMEKVKKYCYVARSIKTSVELNIVFTG
jgi:uncharacterized OsmC-like protein